MMGMPPVISCRTKMNHFLNRLVLTTSFHTVDRMCKRPLTIVESRANSTFDDIPHHEIAVLSTDYVDLTNRHGLLVKGRENFGLHLIAIKCVFCNLALAIPTRVVMPEEDLGNQKDLTDPRIVIDYLVTNRVTWKLKHMLHYWTEGSTISNGGWVLMIAVQQCRR